jgi:mannosyltransferase
VSRIGRRALLIVLLVAFALRMVRLGAESLWYDETVSAYLAGERLPDLVAHTARDIHPPGYYVLLHGWTRVAGDSDAALAYPSLFFGVVLVALAYRLARRTWDDRVGLLAAGLVAISPYHIWYSQEVRMYTLGAVLAAGLLFGMLELRCGRRRGWVLYVVCGALGLWVLYYFAFLLLAVNLVVLVSWALHGLGVSHRHAADAAPGSRRPRPGVGVSGGRGSVGRWVLAQALVGLLYAPWLPVVWRQATDPPVPPWRPFVDLADVLVQTWTALSFGQSVEPGAVWPALPLTALLVGWGVLSRRRQEMLADGLAPLPVALLLVVGFAGPVLLIYLLSFLTPLFHVRYAFTYALPFYVLLAAGLSRVWRRWRLVGWCVLAVMCGVSAWSLVRYHTHPRYASDDHRAAVAALAAHWCPGDAVLVNAGYAYTALEHYWPATGASSTPGRAALPLDRARLVPGAASPTEGVPVYMAGSVDGDPSLGWGSAQSDFFAVSRGHTEQALRNLYARYHRVWHYRIYDTVTDPEGVIRAWLEGRAQSQAADGFPGPFFDRVFEGEANLRLQTYRTDRDPLADATREWEQPLADDALVLVGSEEMAHPAAEVGGAYDLALIWRANTVLDKELTLFVGLFDDTGRRWAQTDDRVPPSRWPAGTSHLVRTPVHLSVPAGTPPGLYRLEVGWYRVVEGQPEWLPFKAEDDRLLLGRVEVVAPANWWELSLPAVGRRAGVTMGLVRLVGWEMPQLEGLPGERLPVHLVWQHLADGAQEARVGLRLTNDAGQVMAEADPAPELRGWTFRQLEPGQAVRDHRAIPLPGNLAAGVYNVTLSLLSAEGAPLQVRRGLIPLGDAYPLATVRVLDRQAEWQPPTPQHPTDLRFGTNVHLVGYDLELLDSDGGETDITRLRLRLYWRALGATDIPYKIFVHLTDPDNPADIRAQADVYPRLPTTAWIPGEYLTDEVSLGVPIGEHLLRLGLYRDDASGARLPTFDARGTPLGDHVRLERIAVKP